MNKRNDKGITLVALVVTIIVLLILAGVTLYTILGDNSLISRTTRAKESYSGAQDEDSSEISKHEDMIDQHENFAANVTEVPKTNTTWTMNEEAGTVTSPNGKVLKIGDYVNYVPDEIDTSSSSENEAYNNLISDFTTYSGNTESNKNKKGSIRQNSLNWRVLDVKDGKLRLISDKPTTSIIKIKGYKGYNNGVYLLNHMCEVLYNNNAVAEKVCALNIEDITSHFKADEIPTYGSTLSPTKHSYPKLIEKEENVRIGDGSGQPETRLSGSEQSRSELSTDVAEAETWQLKKTAWSKDMTTDVFKNSKYYYLFAKDETDTAYDRCWIASRAIYVINTENFARFCIRCISNGGLYSNDIYYSDSTRSANGYEYAVRPVVTLKNTVSISENNGTGDNGSKTNKWQIA